MHTWADRSDRAAVAAEQAWWMERAGSMFADFSDARRRVVERVARHDRMKQRFNADVVRGWTGRTDQDLGRLMAAARATWPSLEQQMAWVEAQSDADLERWVRDLDARERAAASKGVALPPSRSGPRP